MPKATEGKVEVQRNKWQDILKFIDIADTALGRLNKENTNQMKATIKNMTKEETWDQKMNYTRIVISMKGPFNFN